MIDINELHEKVNQFFLDTQIKFESGNTNTLTIQQVQYLIDAMPLALLTYPERSQIDGVWFFETGEIFINAIDVEHEDYIFVNGQWTSEFCHSIFSSDEEASFLFLYGDEEDNIPVILHWFVQ